MHILFFVFIALSIGAPKCTSEYAGGYYCLSPSKFAWCYGQETPVVYDCNSPLTCLCGYTTVNPCSWATDTISNCHGVAGEYLNTEGNVTPPTDVEESMSEDSDFSNVFVLSEPSKHLPLAMKFYPSTWREQLVNLTSQPFYDNRNLYTPSSKEYECSFHPPEKYDKNPSQMWIGRPSATTTISYTSGVTFRLPDRYVGLFYAYALDHYGLNPGMFIGLGAKESFFGAVYGDAADANYFLVRDDFEHYDCYASNRPGLCVDGNLDGPFQVENGAMSSDVSTFGYRFFTRSQDIPKEERVPRFVTDNELMVSTSFRAFHDLYTLHTERAVVLSSLDFHFRHNLLMKMEKIKFVQNLQRRTTRIAKDSLEFATAMYTYNRGIFDTQLIGLLNNCGPDADPAIDCKFDGFGGHSVDIRNACKLVDSVPESELYDYYISEKELDYFLETLEWTYPYDSVKGFHESIPWKTIKNEAHEAWNTLSKHRKSVTSSATGISFRFDFRALLAVVRMRLPPAEKLTGPSVYNFSDYWGKVLNPEMSYDVSPAKYPFPTCSLTGQLEELCGEEAPPESSSSIEIVESSSSKVPESSSSSSSEVVVDQCSGLNSSCVFNTKECTEELGICNHLFKLKQCDCFKEWFSCLESNKCVDFNLIKKNPALAVIKEKNYGC